MKSVEFPTDNPPPSTTFLEKQGGVICTDILEKSQGYPLVKKLNFDFPLILNTRVPPCKIVHF